MDLYYSTGQPWRKLQTLYLTYSDFAISNLKSNALVFVGMSLHLLAFKLKSIGATAVQAAKSRPRLLPKYIPLLQLNKTNSKTSNLFACGNCRF